MSERRGWRSALIAVTVGAAWLVPNVASSKAADERARLLVVLAALRKPRSVSADIEQVKKHRAFKRPQRARGRVLLVPPRQLRWEYTKPYRMTLVLAGTRASMAYPDLDRKQTFDLDRNPEMKAVFDTVLFFLAADAEALERRFSVVVHDGRKLVLAPRSKAGRSLLSRVEATIDLERGVLLSLHIVEPDGDETTITYSNIRTNVRVDPSRLVP